MKRQKLAKEALDWINSLELPLASAPLRDQSGYLYEQRSTRTVGDEATRKAAYRRHLLRCGLSKWIRKHKSKGLKKLRILEHEVNASLRLQDWRSRLCLKKWLQFIQIRRINHYVEQRAELKLAMGMSHRYKLQLYLHYWLQKTNIRLRIKIETFRDWRRSVLARNLARMVSISHITYHTRNERLLALNPVFTYFLGRVWGCGGRCCLRRASRAGKEGPSGR